MPALIPSARIAVQVSSLARTSAAAKNGSKAPAAVVQSAMLAFSKSFSANFDAVARVSDSGLQSGTTRLSVALGLQANRKYSFSFYYPSGGPKVTLTDSKGKSTTVSMASGFAVAKGGNYTLTFDAPYSLKDAASLDNLVINATSLLPSSSGNKKIDALLMGGTNQWWHSWDATAAAGPDRIGGATALAAGSSATALTFSFLSSQPAAQNMTGFQEMTSAQKDAVRRAFAYYGKLIKVDFTEVAGDGAGDINFGTNTQGSSAGYATPPNASGAKDKTFLYLANNQASNGDAGMQEGGYGYLTVLHEIAHTLGLKHPGNYNAGGGGTPGPYLPASEDNRQNTIMAYSDNNFSRGVSPATPMMYDVAALQYLYGANKNASTATDGAFVFSDTQNYLQTLWSANGSDTIDLSAVARSNSVNLNAGTYSSINILGPAGSGSYSGNQNVAIAYGSQINKVRLSSAAGVADTVTLNGAFGTGSFNTISSFDASVDRIGLSKGIFGPLAAKNLQFGASSTASSKDARIIVNTATGEIFYDADGNGKKAAAKKIAQYSAIAAGSLVLGAGNFSFVA